VNAATPDDRHRIYEPHGEVEQKNDLPFGDVSELAKHGDPSRPQVSAVVLSEEEKRRRAVVWVRPTELIPTTTGRVVGRGIDFQAELARRTRALPIDAAAATRDGIRGRTRRAAPLSAFGNSSIHRSSLGREVIGRN
jgi:hypothetical protein